MQEGLAVESTRKDAEDGGESEECELEKNEEIEGGASVGPEDKQVGEDQKAGEGGHEQEQPLGLHDAAEGESRLQPHHVVLAALGP